MCDSIYIKMSRVRKKKPAISTSDSCQQKTAEADDLQSCPPWLPKAIDFKTTDEMEG